MCLSNYVLVLDSVRHSYYSPTRLHTGEATGEATGPQTLHMQGSEENMQTTAKARYRLIIEPCPLSYKVPITITFFVPTRS